MYIYCRTYSTTRTHMTTFLLEIGKTHLEYLQVKN